MAKQGKVTKQQAIDEFKQNGYFIKYDIVGDILVSNIGCICYIIKRETKEVCAIGVSICSLMDQYFEKEAKAKAFWRARKAFLKKETSEPIQDKREMWEDDYMTFKRSIKNLSFEEVESLVDDMMEAFEKMVGEEIPSEFSDEFVQVKKTTIVYDVPRNYCITAIKNLLADQGHPTNKCIYFGA